MADEKRQRVQRIRMRLYGSPVRHDGDLVEFAPASRGCPATMTVEFDGPQGRVKFWQHRSGGLFTDRAPDDVGASYWNYPDDTHSWEVV